MRDLRDAVIDGDRIAPRSRSTERRELREQAGRDQICRAADEPAVTACSSAERHRN